MILLITGVLQHRTTCVPWRKMRAQQALAAANTSPSMMLVVVDAKDRMSTVVHTSKSGLDIGYHERKLGHT